MRLESRTPFGTLENMCETLSVIRRQKGGILNVKLMIVCVAVPLKQTKYMKCA